MKSKSDDRQAALERENAELRRQLAEALDQQTATAEVLQVINSSPGDLAPVFEAMLEKVLRLCDAAFGNLLTYDGEATHVAAFHGALPEHADFFRSASYRAEPGTALIRLVEGEPYLHEADITDTDAYRSGVIARRRLADIAGARTALWVALRKEGVLLGLFTIYRREVRPFTDKQIALLQNFAAQAVIAMENARLLTETREALEQQTATAEVLGVINASPGDVTPVFDAILDKAHSLCNVSSGALILIEDNRYRPIAFHGEAALRDAWFSQGWLPFSGDEGPARLKRGEVVHMLDAADYPWREDTRRLVELGGVRSLLMVPLLKDRVLFGIITAFRQETQPFTDKQIALLQNFAAQAVIAMENARLITETREALEQQTATAEVLRVINSSPGDLAPVFAAILGKAHALCGASHGALFVRDGAGFKIAALHDAPEPLAELLRERGLGPDAPAIHGLLDGAPFVHIPDMTQLDHPVVQATVANGVRTLLSVPLRKGGLLGVIIAVRFEVQPFTDGEIALLQNFAAQAVIAMENARLLGELQQRTGDLQESLEYQTATSDVLKVISGATFDVQPVFETISETATRLCDADFALFSRREGDAYRVVATFAFSSEFDAFIRGRLLPTGRGSLSSRVAAEGLVVHVDDVAADPDYAVPETVTLAQARTVLGVPLLRDGVVIGVIALARKRVKPFGERQIELVRTFADQAVIAIENARLLDELRQRTDEVAELNRGLEARVAAQVDELGRVGNLKRFLPPQVAEMVVSQGDERILESHRREIVVVFCDVRGYTAFSETAEPEEVIEFLGQYHAALGPLITRFEGTLSHFLGDGLMVFFNDPVPCPDPAERAVKMAMAMREAAGGLVAAWRRRGYQMGFGAGVAQGYATLGQIGFADRSDYTAIGTVCNLAARLCGEAQDGQILVAQRVAAGLEGDIALEEIGALTLKGLSQPVVAFNVAEVAAAAGRLRLI